MEKLPLGITVTRPWRTLGVHFSPRILAEILDGGQSFRWMRNAAGIWQGTWGRHVVELHQPDEQPLRWRPLTAGTQENDLRHYLALDAEYTSLLDRLPWRGDSVLQAAMSRFEGLRILRQPLDEALIGFICSTSKRIPQIKQAVARLADRFGPALTPECKALPDWESLADAPDADLQECRLGYRAAYLKKTAARLREDPTLLQDLHTLPYAAAQARLTQLPGVGTKVADCVLLFGAGRMEAFPVDTWITRAMARWYHLESWSPAQIAHFGRQHFAPAPGLAQQFLFAAIRDEIALPVLPPPPGQKG